MTDLTDYYGDVPTAYLRCLCGEPVNMVEMRYNPDWDEVAIYLQMNHYLPWYKRIRPAIRFLLGKKTERGHFSEVVVNPAAIQRVMRYFENTKKAWDIKKGQI